MNNICSIEGGEFDNGVIAHVKMPDGFKLSARSLVFLEVDEAKELETKSNSFDKIKAIITSVEDFGYITGIKFIGMDEVSGNKQECNIDGIDHEYCVQSCTCEDWYRGTIYYPLSDNEYIRVDWDGC
jgi:hypothetical protein